MAGDHADRRIVDHLQGLEDAVADREAVVEHRHTLACSASTRRRATQNLVTAAQPARSPAATASSVSALSSVSSHSRAARRCPT